MRLLQNRLIVDFLLSAASRSSVSLPCEKRAPFDGDRRDASAEAPIETRRDDPRPSAIHNGSEAM